MQEFSNIKRGEFDDDPDHYLVRVAESGIPLIVRMLEADRIDVAIMREADCYALLKLARPADEPPTRDELREAGLAAGRVLAADLFDRQWDWLKSASRDLHAALQVGDQAEILAQADWLLYEVDVLLGSQPERGGGSHVA